MKASSKENRLKSYPLATVNTINETKNKTTAVAAGKKTSANAFKSDDKENVSLDHNRQYNKKNVNAPAVSAEKFSKFATSKTSSTTRATSSTKTKNNKEVIDLLQQGPLADISTSPTPTSVCSISPSSSVSSLSSLGSSPSPTFPNLRRHRHQRHHTSINLNFAQSAQQQRPQQHTNQNHRRARSAIPFSSLSTPQQQRRDLPPLSPHTTTLLPKKDEHQHRRSRSYSPPQILPPHTATSSSSSFSQRFKNTLLPTTSEENESKLTMPTTMKLSTTSPPLQRTRFYSNDELTAQQTKYAPKNHRSTKSFSSYYNSRNSFKNELFPLPQISPFYSDDVFPHFLIQEEEQEEEEEEKEKETEGKERKRVFGGEDSKTADSSSSKILKIRRKVWDDDNQRNDDEEESEYDSICSYSDDDDDDEYDEEGGHDNGAIKAGEFDEDQNESDDDDDAIDDRNDKESPKRHKNNCKNDKDAEEHDLTYSPNLDNATYSSSSLSISSSLSSSSSSPCKKLKKCIVSPDVKNNDVCSSPSYCLYSDLNAAAASGSEDNLHSRSSPHRNDFHHDGNNDKINEKVKSKDDPPNIVSIDYSTTNQQDHHIGQDENECFLRNLHESIQKVNYHRHQFDDSSVNSMLLNPGMNASASKDHNKNSPSSSVSATSFSSILFKEKDEKTCKENDDDNILISPKFVQTTASAISHVFDLSISKKDVDERMDEILDQIKEDEC